MYNPAGFVASCYDHEFDWSSTAIIPVTAFPSPIISATPDTVVPT
jgi:hypothetical protein